MMVLLRGWWPRSKLRTHARLYLAVKLEGGHGTFYLEGKAPGVAQPSSECYTLKASFAGVFVDCSHSP